MIRPSVRSKRRGVARTLGEQADSPGAREAVAAEIGFLEPARQDRRQGGRVIRMDRLSGTGDLALHRAAGAIMGLGTCEGSPHKRR